MLDVLDNPIVTAGWILCLAVIAVSIQGIVLLFRKRTLVSQQCEAQDRIFTEKVRSIQERRKIDTETRETWSGFANFVVVRKVIHGRSGICSFYIRPQDERLALAPFAPGQHLVFQLPTANPPIKRRYSLSDCPNGEYYRISVKQAVPPREKPDIPPGVGSSYFHDVVEEQSRSPHKSLIQVASPSGSFVLDPFDRRPIVLIGGGVGVTPILSMFNSVLENNESREVWLFYGVRNPAESILFDEGMLHPSFEEQFDRRSNIHVIVYYSDSESEKGGKPKVPGVERHAGRITTSAIRGHLESSNYQFYICGPEAMMNDLEEGLVAWGVPEEDVLTERFGPPLKQAGKKADAVSGKITFAQSGIDATFEPGETNLLEVAERVGVPIAYDCRAGSCGTCQVKLVSGKVKNSFRTNYKCVPGSCLSCACFPETDIVLDC